MIHIPKEHGFDFFIILKIWDTSRRWKELFELIYREVYLIYYFCLAAGNEENSNQMDEDQFADADEMQWGKLRAENQLIWIWWESFDGDSDS